MRVRLRIQIAGPAGVFQPGDTPDLEPEQAEALIAARLAEPFEERAAQAVVETTTKAVPETAVTRGRRPRAR
jgi:hypothetical protein